MVTRGNKWTNIINTTTAGTVLRVHELASDASGGDGKEPHQDRDQGRVHSLSQSGDVITAGSYVYAWQRQVVDFYGMRLRKNFEFSRRFAGAGRIGELIGLQHEYVRDTLIDYTSSVYTMAGFGLRSARQTAEVWIGRSKPAAIRPQHSSNQHRP